VGVNAKKKGKKKSKPGDAKNPTLRQVRQGIKKKKGGGIWSWELHTISKKKKRFW